MRRLLQIYSEYKEIINNTTLISGWLGGVVSFFWTVFEKFATVGEMVFKSFASINNISVNVAEFNSALLKQWGKEIYKEAFSGVTNIEYYIIPVLIIAILLFYHLLSKKEPLERNSKYEKLHPWITLAIFLVLLLLVIKSPEHILMFMTLLLLLVYFLFYCYLNFKDKRSSSKVDKTTRVSSCIITLLALTLSPYLYGQKFFEPQVICFDDIDTINKEIRLRSGASAILLFDNKKLQGYLMKQPVNENNLRSLHIEENPDLDEEINITKILRNSDKVSLKSLLIYKYIQNEAESVVDEEEKKTINKDIKTSLSDFKEHQKTAKESIDFKKGMVLR